ncbi:thioredoxin domain-containing protein [bacterium]|nr:MAG: thioredoxin domain-containing protein [bacterium]
MNTESKAPPNRLIGEKSPYLLQHAHNPVDWYPWCDEAFEKATAEDKPVFLSIGYSTCHWCHVMEEESFCDPEVAQILNRDFISIKVDREERPDLDHIYMATCQLVTGSGGWPLTIFMTPEKKPFFAGSYFPKITRFGRMGMLELLDEITNVWQKERQKVTEATEDILSTLKESLSPTSGKPPGDEIVDQVFHELSYQYESRYGGFGKAPKFPTPGNLFFLLRYWKRTGNPEALQMVEKTLRSMKMGGIYDHIGFGFHRYSTDAQWLVPHFEKMLYDQALLAMAYTEAYQATGKEEYSHTALEIFTYVLRDMTGEPGAFYSAEDADSEGEEGKFYTWTTSEIEKILNNQETLVIRKVYNLQDAGNFSPEAGRHSDQNILHRTDDLGDLASGLDMSEDDLIRILYQAREKLYKVRSGRTHPYKDDKILTDWNGLMIAALAKGAAVFRENKYAAAAEKSAGFILQNMKDGSGQLLHRYREDSADIPGNIDDYAFLIWGLVELYQATFNIQHLEEAVKLSEEMISRFWDDNGGGFFFTHQGNGPLPILHKTAMDGATPSGNAVAAENLLRLGRITADPGLEERVAAIGGAFSSQINQYPAAFVCFAYTLAMATDPSLEVVIAGDPDHPDTREMTDVLHSEYLPNMVAVFAPTSKERSRVVSLAPYVRDMNPIGNKATSYVCRNYVCQAPTNSVEEMLGFLKKE